MYATPELLRFSSRLLGARLRAGLSQRELAVKMKDRKDAWNRSLGISYAYISRLESGDRYPSYEVVYALADSLEVDRHWLLYGDEEETVRS